VLLFTNSRRERREVSKIEKIAEKALGAERFSHRVYGNKNSPGRYPSEQAGAAIWRYRLYMSKFVCRKMENKMVK